MFPVIWITAAIGATAILGVVNIIDSHLIAKRMPSLRAFLLPVGIMHLGWGLIIFGVFPLPGGIGTAPLVVAFGSGIVRSVGILLMLSLMRSEDVSRIIPVVHTFPIFVAILAVPLLGESLGYVEWLAISMTVAGAVLISARWDVGGRQIHLHKSFAALMASSLFLGVANTASKYALDDMSFWNMYSVNAICFGVVFLAVSVRVRTLGEFRSMKERNPAMALVAFGECVALTGIIMSFWAIEQGPVSLVSAVLGVRPGFVFIYALALSRLFPAVLEESLTGGTVATKIVSIILIVSGVIVINLR